MQVVTTITTLIDVDTLEPTHSVEIVGEAGIPQSIAKAAAIGGARALLRGFEADDNEEGEE